jgi:molybdopterin-synthase adenylyltransferase
MMNLLQVNRDFPPASLPKIGWPDRQNLGDPRVVVLGRGTLGLTAAEILRGWLPNARIESSAEQMNSTAIESFILDADIVLDASGSDNQRYLINRACLKLGIPWVFAAVRDGYGLVMVIIPGKTPCYECVMGRPDHPVSQPHVPILESGVIPKAASLQAAQAAHLLMGDSQWPHGLIYIDAWASSCETIEIKGKKGICPACGLGMDEPYRIKIAESHPSFADSIIS